MIRMLTLRTSIFFVFVLANMALLGALAGCNNSPSSNKENEQAKNDGSGIGGITLQKKSDGNRIKLDVKGLSNDEPNKNFAPDLKFTEVQDEAGINFIYKNGQQGLALMVETTGGGTAWFDYDLDGNQDAFLCQGGDPTKPATKEQPIDRFFRHLDLGKFDEVVQMTGIEEHGYSQGVSAGDFDGDGFDDLYVTNCGKNTLWRNLGDGSFEEITDIAGVGCGERWSSTSAWADIDLDGDLDLYVCNYVQYDRFNPPPCLDDQGRPAICHPKHADAWPDALFINHGDGTFSDESSERGVKGKGNKALGVAIADFNRDGFPDIYVANDTTANFFFVNDGKAHFEEVAGVQGCDVDRNGSFQASMGLGIFDYDENGLLDIFLTHYEDESNTLYKNKGELGFQDVTAAVKLFTKTLPWLGFGTIMTDFNNDGRADIFVAQGHVNNTIHYAEKQKMPAALFSYDGNVFHELTDKGGEYFSRKFVGRGTAICDYDRDGDWDLMVNHQNEKSSLLRNDSKSGNYIKLGFVGLESNRKGYNVQVTVKAGERKLFQELVAGTSYVSSNEPALIFGLGEFKGECSLEVRWPSGKTMTFDKVALNQSLILAESGDMISQGTN